jgi:hypothetical protein
MSLLRPATWSRTTRSRIQHLRVGCLGNLGLKIVALVIALVLYVYLSRSNGGAEAPAPPAPSTCPCPSAR